MAGRGPVSSASARPICCRCWRRSSLSSPFVISGFHSDNGSEYVNHRVSKLLEKLRIEQTKSRPRQSNDNALAESKNASTVRKHMGYDHIPQKYAKPINTFYQEIFNPWLNLHRPCLFATSIANPKGKIVKRYKHARCKYAAGVPGSIERPGTRDVSERHQTGCAPGAG